MEDSEIYTDDSDGPILADSDDVSGQPAMLPASDPGLGSDPAYGADASTGSVFDQAGVGMGPAAMAGGAPVAAAAAAAPEAPYTIWQVISLASVAGILAMGGIVGYDVARNLWMAEDTIISSGLLKFFLDITGMS